MPRVSNRRWSSAARGTELWDRVMAARQPYGTAPSCPSYSPGSAADTSFPASIRRGRRKTSAAPGCHYR